MKNRYAFITAILTASTLMGAQSLWAGDAQSIESRERDLRIGSGVHMDNMPAFNLPDLEGKMHSSSEWEGKAVVLDFWATWCSTCKETVPFLVEVAKQNAGKPLIVVGISVDKSGAEKVAREAKRLGINYQILLDKDQALSAVFGFKGIPSLYLFDGKGALVKAIPGYDPGQEAAVKTTIDALAEPAVAKPAPIALRQTEREQDVGHQPSKRLAASRYGRAKSKNSVQKQGR